MANQTITLGASSFDGNRVWRGAVLINSLLVAGGATAYLRYIRIQFGGSVEMRFASSTTANPSSEGPELNSTWETYDDAIVFSEAGGSSITLKGPNHADNSFSDPSEPYFWTPDNSDDAAAWLTGIGNGVLTLVLDDGIPNLPPIVTITTQPQTVDPGDTIDLEASAVDQDGTISSYMWTGAGTFSDATIAEPTWTAPNNAGETVYNLNLAVTDNLGNVGNAGVAITVRAVPETVSFSAEAGDPTANFDVTHIDPNVPLALSMSARAGNPTAQFVITAPGLELVSTSARGGNPTVDFDLRVLGPPQAPIVTITTADQSLDGGDVLLIGATVVDDQPVDELIVEWGHLILRGIERVAILDGGTGYQVNDVLVASGGSGFGAQFTVSAIGANGAITTLVILSTNQGLGYLFGDVLSLDGINGSGAMVEVEAIDQSVEPLLGGATLENTDSFAPIFTAPPALGVDQFFEIACLVTDMDGNKSSDAVNITVRRTVPVMGLPPFVLWSVGQPVLSANMNQISDIFRYLAGTYGPTRRTNSVELPGVIGLGGSGTNTFTGDNRAAAQAARDAYFVANSGELAQYDNDAFLRIAVLFGNPTFTGSDRVAAEASRDTHFVANPDDLALFDEDSLVHNPDGHELGIVLSFGTETVYQRRIAGESWQDAPVYQGRSNGLWVDATSPDPPFLGAYLALPQGNGSQRPAGVAGRVRYNADQNLPEYFTDQWDAPTAALDFVNFENLNGNGDVGTAANQVSVGNHTH